MADRWKVAHVSGGDWHDVDIWGIIENGASGASIPDVDKDVFFSDFSDPDDCILTGHATCKSITQSGTNIYTGNLNIQIFNLVVAGLSDIYGGLQIGGPVDTGFTTAGLNMRSGSTLTLHKNAKINCSGLIDFADEEIISPQHGYMGTFTQTASANGSNPSYYNKWNKFIINAGVRITQTSDFYYTGGLSDEFNLQGEIDVGNYIATVGALNTGVFTLGANCDIITGSSGRVNFTIRDGATVTLNKTAFPNFTGKVNIIEWSADPLLGLVADFSNADYEFSGFANGITVKMMAGTLKCKDFKINQAHNQDVTIDCATSDPNFEWSGDVDFHAGTGTYDTIWTKGSGTIKAVKTGVQNWDFYNCEVENVTINSGAEVAFGGDLRCDDFVCNGKIALDSGNTHVVKNPSGNGTIHGDGSDTIIYYSGSNTFSGSMEHGARWEELGEQTPRAYYGLRMDKALKLKV